MKKNHRKNQNMWSSHITTNNSCCYQQLIFLTPDWLFSCNIIAYTCRYDKGCFGHWELGTRKILFGGMHYNTQLQIPAMPKATFTESAIFPEIFLMFTGLTKQVTFCNANTGFPAKCHEEMLPGSVWCFKLVCCVRNKFTSTNPKHYIIFSIYTPLKIAVYYCRAVPVSVNKFNILFSYSPSYKSTQFNPIQFIDEHLFQKASQMPIMFCSYLCVWDIRRGGYYSL